jgi:hypothetical protein
MAKSLGCWEKSGELTSTLLRQAALACGATNTGWYWDECEFARVAFSRCESPIEELFLAFLCAAPSSTSGGGFTWIRSETTDEPVGIWSNGARLFQQLRVCSSRVDFAIMSEDLAPVAIELDGHEFHERTKEQAARDKSKDRMIQESDWKILRFTGSEIWNKTMACADEAFRIATGGE